MFILIWIFSIQDIVSVNDAIITRIVIDIENQTKCFSLRTIYSFVHVNHNVIRVNEI